MGTILSTIGQQAGIDVLVQVGDFAKSAAGPAMAVSIGFALKAPSLVLFSLVAVGYAANSLGGAGGPLAVLVVAIVASECGKLVANETKIDILVTPSVTILVGVFALHGVRTFHRCGCYCGRFAYYVGYGASAVLHGHFGIGFGGHCPYAANLLGGYLRSIEPYWLAGGAAVAGCCAQMVGFAVMSFKENRWGGLISQGLGTSMLQMGNIVRNQRIWIPPTLASVITGPIATCIFQLKMNGPAISSGMGTCGLVGPIGVYTGWVADMASGAMTAITAMDWAGLVLICFVLPAVLTYAFGLVLRKIGWIKEGDLTLESADDMVKAE